MMKRLILATVLSAIGFLTVSAREKYGVAVFAGYDAMFVRERVGGVSNVTGCNGVGAGCDYTYNVWGPLNLTAGISYYASFKDASGSVVWHDLQLPVEINGGYEFGPFYGFVYFRPAFNVNLQWLEKYKDYYRSVYEEATADNYNRYDMTLGGGIGLVYNKMIRLKLGYDGGVVNMYKGEFRRARLTRGQFTITLAYCF